MSAKIIPFPTRPLPDIDGLRQQYTQDLAALAAHALGSVKAPRHRLTNEQAVALAQHAVLASGPARAAGLPLGLVLAAKISHQLYLHAASH